MSTDWRMGRLAFEEGIPWDSEGKACLCLERHRSHVRVDEILDRSMRTSARLTVSPVGLTTKIPNSHFARAAQDWYHRGMGQRLEQVVMQERFSGCPTAMLIYVHIVPCLIKHSYHIASLVALRQVVFVAASRFITEHSLDTHSHPAYPRHQRPSHTPSMLIQYLS